MKVQSSVRARLCGVAFLMALAAGCGGGDGSVDPGPGPGAPSAPPAGPPAVPEVRGWSQPFGSAGVVLGQADFVQHEPEAADGIRFTSPRGAPAITHDGKLVVAANGEVLIFSNYDSASGVVPDFRLSLGQAGPVDVSTQGQKLVLSDYYAAQVLVFNETPTSSVAPDATAGDGAINCSSTSLEQQTAAYLTPTGRLIVADASNHRVLIWNQLPMDGGPLGDANVVLGQRRMNRCIANDDLGDGSSDDHPTNRTMSYPVAVWSDGVRLIVSDSGNNRLLIWNDISTVVNEAADHVVGQPDHVSFAPNAGQALPSAATLSRPGSVDVSAAGELAVADTGNHRVLIWSAIPTSVGTSARYVVGQGDFEHGAANDLRQTGQHGTSLSAKTLNAPEGVRFHGRNLIVNDSGNDRVLVWRESN